MFKEFGSKGATLQVNTLVSRLYQPNPIAMEWAARSGCLDGWREIFKSINKSSQYRGVTNRVARRYKQRENGFCANIGGLVSP